MIIVVVPISIVGEIRKKGISRCSMAECVFFRLRFFDYEVKFCLYTAYYFLYHYVAICGKQKIFSFFFENKSRRQSLQTQSKTTIFLKSRSSRQKRNLKRFSRRMTTCSLLKLLLL